MLEKIEPPVICSNYHVSPDIKNEQDLMLSVMKKYHYMTQLKIAHDLFRQSLFLISHHLDLNHFLFGKIQVYRFDLDAIFPKLKTPMTLFGENIHDVSNVKQGVYFCVRAIASYNAKLAAFSEGARDNGTLDAMSNVQEIVYIGKANDLKSRFAQHHKMALLRRLNVTAVYFIEYNPDVYSELECLWAEREYIKLLRPILNDNSIDLDCSKEEDIKLKESFNKGYAAATTKLMKYFDSEIQQAKLK